MKSSLVSILPFFLFFLSTSLSQRCNQNDKKALLEIKKSLGNPHDLITWDPKTDCCNDWSQTTLSCDDNTNRVTSLILIKIQNAGYISPSIHRRPFISPTFRYHEYSQSFRSNSIYISQAYESHIFKNHSNKHFRTDP